jgi:hypothetical protein
VVGLTSARNRDFVAGLGCYDEVRLYEEIESLAQTPTVYLDFSGNAGVRGRVHRHYRELLGHSAIIGSTHWNDRSEAAGEMPGAEPTLFFAPSRSQKRTADWGGDELLSRIGKSWSGFVSRVRDSDPPWVRVVRGEGLDAVVETYEALVGGNGSAAEGHVLTV